MSLSLQASCLKENERALRFLDEEVSFAMRKGFFVLLTVIPKEHLLMGIEFVAGMIDEYIQELYVKDSDKYEASNKCWTATFWDSYFNK